MLGNIIRLGGLALVVLFSSISIAAVPAAAQSSTCSSSLDPHLVNPITDEQVFFFTISNDGLPSSAQWVKISRPSTNFAMVEAVNLPNGVNAVVTPDAITFSGPNIDLVTGNSMQLEVGSAVGITETASANWLVQLSTDPSGSSPVACSGSLGTAVYTYIPSSDYVVGVRDITVSGITDSSADIAWNSDVPTNSLVLYGQSTDFYTDKSSLGSTYTTTHKLTLTGLSANTGYHFQVAGVDIDGYPKFSSDSTFLTTVTPPKIENQTPIGTAAVAKTAQTEKTLPIISLSTDLSKIYKQPPLINGIASDNTALAAIEYSIDGGQNWLPADSVTGLTSRNAAFSFSPLNLADGNYKILARAIDTSGNIGMTQIATLIIDRLPPLVGGNLITLGPQTLKPDSNGLISTLVGIDQKITMSAVGGPTNITIEATSSDSKNKVKSFSMTQSAETGLWAGILSFETPGTYSLLAKSVDGAGNKVSRVLNTINVTAPASVVRAGTDKPVVSKTSVYYWEAESSQWVVWDGAAYGQDNPVLTDKKGQFSLVLPAGKYYLKTSAKDYKTLTSNIFKLNDSTPISTTLNLKPLRGLQLGSVGLHWPDFSVSKINLNLKNSTTTKQNSQVGQPVPVFSLSDTNGKQVSSLDFLGKPTVLSVMATWAPQTNEQLKALSDIQPNGDINVEALAAQENAAQVRVYTDISGYKLNWLVDPDSITTKTLNFTSLPTHYFIDRKGVIKNIVTGVLTKQQLLNYVSSL